MSHPAWPWGGGWRYLPDHGLIDGIASEMMAKMFKVRRGDGGAGVHLHTGAHQLLLSQQLQLEMISIDTCST